ncbi:MAG: hypothetical protein ACYTE8_13035 [Planctomycetota bacterium]|jgi:hypothetical protein
MSKKKIEEINKKIKDLEAELVEQESNLYITCKDGYFKDKAGCGRRVKIKNTIIFIGQIYIEPYS